MKNLDMYSYDLTVYPKGDAAEIERFRMMVADGKEEFSKKMGEVTVYDPKDLHFECRECRTDPTDFFAKLYKEFSGLFLFLAIDAYDLKDEYSFRAYAFVENGKIRKIPARDEADPVSGLPEQFVTPEIYGFWLKVSKGGFCGKGLGDVPEKYRTAEVCRIALAKRGSDLKYVSESLLTGTQGSELCRIAVSNDGEALQYVPEEFKTLKICVIAYSHIKLDLDGKILKHVPESIKEQVEDLSHWNADPDRLLGNAKNVEEALDIVRKSGCLLKYLPEEFKTEEVCLEAVRKDEQALQFVPEELKTKEFCLEVVKRNGLALEYVPEVFKTEELCLEAVKQNGLALDNVPEVFKTEEWTLPH